MWFPKYPDSCGLMWPYLIIQSRKNCYFVFMFADVHLENVYCQITPGIVDPARLSKRFGKTGFDWYSLNRISASQVSGKHFQRETIGCIIVWMLRMRNLLKSCSCFHIFPGRRGEGGVLGYCHIWYMEYTGMCCCKGKLINRLKIYV